MAHSCPVTACHTADITWGIHPRLDTLHQSQHTKQQKKA